MKYIFYFMGILIFLTSCAPSTYSDYSAFTERNLGYYKYTSSARSFSQSWIENYHAIDSSQYEANRLAVNACNARANKRDCFVAKEGKQNVWDKNVAHLKAKEEKEKKEKELTKQKKKEEAEIASRNNKRNTCTEMGFKDETEGMANCILQLTLQENNNSQVVSSSNDDGMLDAMNEQNSIMKKQLRIQRQQNIRQVMKRNQCILNNLNDWYTKC